MNYQPIYRLVKIRLICSPYQCFYSCLFLFQLKNGFFIEAGSVDAESYSDTLYFELKHNWTGLLGNLFRKVTRYLFVCM